MGGTYSAGINEIDWDDPNDPYNLEADRKLREALKIDAEKEAKEKAKAEQAKSNLSFTKDELDQYTDFRTKGIAPKSRDWILRSAEALWANTHGEISQSTLDTLRNHVLEKYKSPDSHSKVLGFAKSFLERLAATRGEPRYQTFTPYLKLPKALKKRKQSPALLLRRTLKTSLNTSNMSRVLEKSVLTISSIFCDSVVRGVYRPTE